MSRPALIFAPYIRDATRAERAPWRVPVRRLLDYLLVAVREGACQFIVDEVAYEVSPGDFFLAGPGQSVDLVGKTATVTPYAHFDLFYNARREESFATRPGQLDLTPYAHLLQPSLAAWGAKIPVVFRPPSLAMWHQQLDQVVALTGDEVPLHKMEAEARLGALIMDMAHHFSMGGSAPVSAPSGGAMRPELGWVPSYFSTHLADDLRVADMARRARLSPSRFQFLFRRVYGTSPGHYLLSLRIAHATELLDGTDWTLAHIASLCGFANVQHFAKTYKQRTGVTPGSRRRGPKPVHPRAV